MERLSGKVGTGRKHDGGPPVDRPALAASLMLAALFLLSFQDSLVKVASADLSLWQFQFLRSGCNLLFLVVLSRLLWGGGRVRPQRWGAVALRSILLVTTMVLFFGGVPFLTLAEIGAGLYVFPLFIALLSALVLGERVGPRRLAAIVSGFAGTLLILKPGAESFQWVSLMPVGAALSYAAMVLTTRKLCRQERPATLALGVSITVLGLGALGMMVMTFLDQSRLALEWPYLFTAWHPVSWYLAGLIVLCSALNLTANISLAKAYQSAESSWLAPFDYSYLIFATLWGVVIWGDLPDLLSFVGMTMIAGAGSYVAWREARAAQGT